MLFAVEVENAPEILNLLRRQLIKRAVFILDLTLYKWPIFFEHMLKPRPHWILIMNFQLLSVVSHRYVEVLLVSIACTAGVLLSHLLVRWHSLFDFMKLRPQLTDLVMKVYLLRHGLVLGTL